VQIDVLEIPIFERQRNVVSSTPCLRLPISRGSKTRWARWSPESDIGVDPKVGYNEFIPVMDM